MAIRVTLSNRTELTFKDDRYSISKESGVLTVKSDDGRVMVFSQSGWLGVEELQKRPPSQFTAI